MKRNVPSVEVAHHLLLGLSFRAGMFASFFKSPINRHLSLSCLSQLGHVAIPCLRQQVVK